MRWSFSFREKDQRVRAETKYDELETKFEKSYNGTNLFEENMG
jgi:hypothetical protein